ncbi:hypothetical protein R3P38DRAFT_3291869 [Favolaschia claudopus]|uniref:F-box domain-containing protein n=1 Tax=Favolaschia claudopus TaxID=2862362 RepID=A0AAV9ZM60_9AGAR
MPSQNPFKVPELLDLCISCLESPSDLISCALVARSWVHPAQSNLFRAPGEADDFFISRDTMAENLADTLTAFPHLIRYVRVLRIEPSSDLSGFTLRGLCEIAFTHVDILTLNLHIVFTPTTIELLEPVLQLPTLRHLTMYSSSCYADTMRVLTLCSPSIKHLDLECWSGSTEAVLPAPSERQAPSFRLTSLQLFISDDLSFSERALWSSPLPFDVSAIKAISTGIQSPFPWHTIHRDLIQILELSMQEDQNKPFDLSLFPNRRYLSFHNIPAQLSLLLPTLKTIQKTNPHSIHTITISLTSKPTACAELDLLLGKLGSPLAAVEFELRDKLTANVERLFPRLVEQKMFRSIHRSPSLVEARWRDLVESV